MKKTPLPAGFEIRRIVRDYAYPLNGNVGDPTPRVSWDIWYGGAHQGTEPLRRKAEEFIRRYASEIVAEYPIEFNHDDQFAHLNIAKTVSKKDAHAVLSIAHRAIRTVYDANWRGALALTSDQRRELKRAVEALGATATMIAQQIDHPEHYEDYKETP